MFFILIFGGCTEKPPVPTQKVGNHRTHTVTNPKIRPIRSNKPPQHKVSKTIIKKSEATKIQYLGTEIFQKYSPAVFMVYTLSEIEDRQGSGFFISSDGVAVSNYHVFQNTNIGAETILLSNGKKYKVDYVVKKDEENDLIIFKVESKGDEFVYIPLAKSFPKVGEKVYAIGSPRGLQNTFSSGEISQIRDSYILQINVPIDHGSSGGALINEYGEAIGITSGGIDTSTANLNYAISIEIVARYLKQSNQNHIKDIEKRINNLPQHTVAKALIEYRGYSTSYNSETKIPIWVKYELTASETDGPYSRKGKDFRQDLSVNYPQADDNDYKGSGWSRGHMAPSGDFKWDNDAMWDTFYYTNCCPQNSSLNSGQWNNLEQKVRNWAKKFGSITVVTGPIIGDNKYGTIGHNKIVVPNAFFKAILASEQAIAFVMYNQSKNEKIPKCAMSIDSLEELVKLDFFSELDDDIENEIESTFILEYWNL